MSNYKVKIAKLEASGNKVGVLVETFKKLRGEIPTSVSILEHLKSNGLVYSLTSYEAITNLYRILNDDNDTPLTLNPLDMITETYGNVDMSNINSNIPFSIEVIRMIDRLDTNTLIRYVMLITGMSYGESILKGRQE